MNTTYADDITLLKQKTDVIELSNADATAKIAIVPAYQGRVMTSTATGANGDSYGWINRELISSGEVRPQINAYGGEERLWLGPEGGQFSLFFAQNSTFDFENWQTPDLIDTQGWPITDHLPDSVSFSVASTLQNRSGSSFDLRLDRTVKLLDDTKIASVIGTPTNGVAMVGYSSQNAITNNGSAAWSKETGLISIWMLGMFNPSPSTVIILPFKTNSDDTQKQIVNDAYFGKVPADRLVIDHAKKVALFKGDGTQRGKIGIDPRNAVDIIGSYTPELNVLTILRFTLPENTSVYVNSKWEIQTDPFGGDVVNSYNDGPLDSGGQLGPFYEMESSSPAVALNPGQTIQHDQTTIHLQGEPDALEPIVFSNFGVHLSDLADAFG